MDKQQIDTKKIHRIRARSISQMNDNLENLLMEDKWNSEVNSKFAILKVKFHGSPQVRAMLIIQHNLTMCGFNERRSIFLKFYGIFGKN